MSGAVGAEVMSMDSGPESEFKFQDLDQNKSGETETEPKQAKLTIKKRSVTFKEGKIGIPKPPSTFAKNNGIIGDDDLDADEIINQKKESPPQDDQ